MRAVSKRGKLLLHDEKKKTGEKGIWQKPLKRRTNAMGSLFSKS